MKILICGDRNWENKALIKSVLQTVQATIAIPMVVVHGDCRGADRLSGLEVKVYPADWDKNGKAAGHIRNQEMLDKETPNVVLAFHNDLKNSKGTLDMVFRANKAGIKVVLYSGK